MIIMSSSSEQKLTVTVKDDGSRNVTDSNKVSAKPRRMTAEEIIEAEKNFFGISNKHVVTKSVSPVEVMDTSVPNEPIVTSSSDEDMDTSIPNDTSPTNEPTVEESVIETENSKALGESQASENDNDCGWPNSPDLESEGDCP